MSTSETPSFYLCIAFGTLFAAVVAFYGKILYTKAAATKRQDVTAAGYRTRAAETEAAAAAAAAAAASANSGGLDAPLLNGEFRTSTDTLSPLSPDSRESGATPGQRTPFDSRRAVPTKSCIRTPTTADTPANSSFPNHQGHFPYNPAVTIET